MELLHLYLSFFTILATHFQCVKNELGENKLIHAEQKMQTSDDKTIKPMSLNAIVKRSTNNADISQGNDTAQNYTNGDHVETNKSHGDSNNTLGHKDNVHHSIHVAAWKFKHVQGPFIIAVFILFAGVAKLCFHNAECLSSHVPESCLLIILGTVVGAIFHLSLDKSVGRPTLTSELFFLYLLPPIILESAYSLHDRTFYENVGTVIIYAVIGTVLNCFLIGPALYGLISAGAMGSSLNIDLISCLVFSAIIVAVDPVAVLAIFQEVGVNNVLYFLVFGESLLNDAVTVVLYNMMKTFNIMPYITIDQVVLGIVSFFVVSCGGLGIGVLFGILTAVITKYTEHCRVVEPLAVFTIAYISYLTAEMFHFSGIISIITCGLTQAQYAFHNISRKSHTTVKYFSKMQSSTSDCLIFMFLGFTLYQDYMLNAGNWDIGFIIWTLVLCLVVRFLVVFGLTFIINKSNRLRKLDIEEQFIMAYGGLRGAVAFSLVDLLDDKNVEKKGLFITTTMVLIFFTVFVQGITIKPLVKMLRVKMEEQKGSTISEEINVHVTDHVMAGIEEILGEKGEHYVREVIEHYNNRYFKHWLQRDPITADDQIMQLYEKIALRQHFENLAGSKMIQEKYGQGALSEEDLTSLEEDVEAIVDDSSSEDLVLPSTTISYTPIVSPSPDLSGSDLDIIRDKAEKRRKSYFPGGIANRRESQLPENPTPKDIRKIMAPTRRQMQITRLDKNLKSDDSEHDLLRYLQEKQNRTRRMSRAVLSISPSPGITEFNKSPRKSVTNSTANYRRRLSLAVPQEQKLVNKKRYSDGNILKGMTTNYSPNIRRFKFLKSHSKSVSDESDENELSPLRKHKGDKNQSPAISQTSLDVISEHSEERSPSSPESPTVTASPKHTKHKKLRLRKSRSLDGTKSFKSSKFDDKKIPFKQSPIKFRLDSCDTSPTKQSVELQEAVVRPIGKSLLQAKDRRKLFNKSQSLMERGAELPDLEEEEQSCEEAEKEMEDEAGQSREEADTEVGDSLNVKDTLHKSPSYVNAVSLNPFESKS